VISPDSTPRLRPYTAGVALGFVTSAVLSFLTLGEPAPAVAAADISEMEYAYDPRLTKIEDAYCIQWCNGYHGPTIGMAWTTDFVHFEQLENAILPYNRNGALFPSKINGNYAMLSRPSDTGHTRFGVFSIPNRRTWPTGAGTGM
jgi:predicted GH43/DUF377 family glycosyl hydrolase